MKKRLCLFAVFVLVFQLISIPFLYVEAGNNQQPKTCNGPSQMMGYYFDFQREMKSVLLGTELNSERFSASFGPGGLFSNRVLELHTTTAIDLLSSSIISNIQSFVSNSLTSLSIFMLASVSVVQSNVEGLAILFTDWPIVRDYKTMLNIETDLFDIAYFRSMEIDLDQPISSDMKNEIRKVIKKYQDLGLLTGNVNNEIKGGIFDIVEDLVWMNASMKQFIMVGGKSIGKSGLSKYRGCFGNVKWDGKSKMSECSDTIALIRFSDTAVDQLYNDYKDVRSFGKCNAYASHFIGTVSKVINNNMDEVSSAVQDMSNAVERLSNAYFTKKRWDLHDPCKDLSEYERIQLQAYWGGNWKCGNGVNLFTTKTYIKDKVAHFKQKLNSSNILREAANPKDSSNVNDDLKKAETYQQKAEIFAKTMGKRDLNSHYDFELGSGFLSVITTTLDEFEQTQESAISVDISSLLGQIKGSIQQVDVTIKDTNELKKLLKEIEIKQCYNGKS